MSDTIEAQDTNQADDVKTDDATLATQDVDNKPEDKGPEPIYKDEDPDSKEETADENKDDQEPGEKGDDEGDEKEPEQKADSDEKSEEYESLDTPEGSLLSDADMERILTQSKEEGLSKEAAQKQVTLANDILKASQERLDQAHSDLSKQWIDDVKNDKELGGEKFDDSIELANKAIKRFGTEEFIESLNETKFGNNPEVVRIFARIGKAMSPDELVVASNHVKPEKSFEETFYPNQA